MILFHGFYYSLTVCYGCTLYAFTLTDLLGQVDKQRILAQLN